MEETQKRIGQVVKGPAERDAIHIAVAPMKAGHTLYKGSLVQIKDGTADTVESTTNTFDAVGIVDPFLISGAKEGETVWVFLFPNTITGMRHHWSHPIFDATPREITEDEIWLRKFADKWEMDFEAMVSEADEGDYIIAGTALHSAEELGGDHDEFWYHLGRYKGKYYSSDHIEGTRWRCSC